MVTIVRIINYHQSLIINYGFSIINHQLTASTHYHYHHFVKSIIGHRSLLDLVLVSCFQIFIIIAHGHQLWILNHQILLIILVVNVGQRALLGVTLHLVGELKLVKYCIMKNSQRNVKTALSIVHWPSGPNPSFVICQGCRRFETSVFFFCKN